MSEIVVRRAQPSDASAIAAIYAQGEACAQTLQLPMANEPLWQSRLQNIPDNVTSLVAEYDGIVIGNLGLELCPQLRRRHVAHFGMGVKDEFHGKGVGSALIKAALDLADNWLNVRRLELNVYIDNRAAIALYEKHGFVIEGESKDFAFRNGEYVNVFHMARIKQGI
ncbi:GNAT family N-acetyltransferase [Vibrio sp. SCSIO 43136]|uniref:GNAT family N-acetyltransferase n=1 Tax=Vibrio sp. SCSIO 43136 TaxID=2819101 RepID=UPI0020758858|nr:GNAT family N-acetyltransferase [Vibrio sp. SCSIO 43136]USD66963.1 GNAT family N-acetyltransferase [Vibrio sp. SCSIO 43136]